ncbi:MAG TPA: hypothetical protein DCE23_05995, partial [Firmicutes bacterium]|nr:hypothetical protein [Bacillota bacterium]
MKLFLIAGKAGSGKNEVADIIKKNLNNSIVTGFSKYIKLFALEFTNWDGRDFHKPRAVLQSIGDTLRSVREDFLTKRIKEDLLVYKKLGIENVIVSDVRLINEIEYFKKEKDIEVITIRVNTKTSKKNLNESEKNHRTELEL